MRDRQRNVVFEDKKDSASGTSAATTATSTPSPESRTRSTVDDLINQFSDSSIGAISPIRSTRSVPAGTFYRYNLTAQNGTSDGTTYVVMESNNNTTSGLEGASQGDSTIFHTAASAMEVDETPTIPPKRGGSINGGAIRKPKSSGPKL